MSESTARLPAHMGVDAEQVAMNFPRPIPTAPAAWRAAKVNVPEHVEVLAEGVGYPS